MARPSLSNVNLNLLVALDALLATVSVSDAARRVRVTKSAMSHSLAALREMLEDQLLVRVGGRMALTPYAEAVRAPLSEVLGGVTKIIEGASAFEPVRARRRFVIAAPDFFAALIVPSLLEGAQKEAPGVELSIVPSARRGNARMLESGEIDLALGAVIDDAPGIRRRELFTERFQCAVRKGHPEIRDRLTVEQFARTPQLVITLGDDDQPTWIDEALARKGYSRRAVVGVRYFVAAPLIVARTDLLVTAPATVLDYFSKLVPLTLLEPPLQLPTYAEEAYWHARYDADPTHRWLRELIVSVTAKLGTGTRPERTRWNEPSRPSKPRSRRQKRGV